MRFKLTIVRFAGVAGLALLVLAATSEGVVSRDLVSAIAISLSITAMVAAFLAFRHATTMQRKAQDYFAQIDAATLRLELSRGRKIDVATSPEVARSIAGEARPLAVRSEPSTVARPLGLRPTVIEGGKGKTERVAGDTITAEDALLVALSNHDLTVSLEPVVELQSSKIIAYRVHAHLAGADGTGVDVRRLAKKYPGIDSANFDMELFHAAASAVRRFLGTAADDTPLICPLGQATLASSKDLRKIVAMMTALPMLQSGLVLEVPAEALLAPGIMMTGTALLAEAGLRIALEGEIPLAIQSSILEQFSFEFWSRRSGEIVYAVGVVSDAHVVATHVSEDHEVIAMIDAGVSLVCGPRFSLAKPIKARGEVPEYPVSQDRERKGGLF